MKAQSIVIGLGLILLYFVDAALKIQLFTPEMLTHSGIRFFTGFVILGIGVFYEHIIKLKMAIIIVLMLALADDALDYYRHVDSFHFEVLLHGLYMMLWGAVMGYTLMKSWKVKRL
ncbi:hypothetical protein [Crenothrix polyspora]|uniref:Uncharacterized protein n=1 Tax=Crenothrix polyspora TaxID=360316 RepID=A0A1R4HC48_9GAMM|nr:hypothetical protein [Crenothrix polyspora]SJM93832.1 conserved membrane hypothetical protein [Crenothrix polyspora]